MSKFAGIHSRQPSKLCFSIDSEFVLIMSSACLGTESHDFLSSLNCLRMKLLLVVSTNNTESIDVILNIFSSQLENLIGG